MLILTITRHGGRLPAEGASRSFGTDMVTLGRGEINDWVLPDPERLLSKRHCVINWRDGRYSVLDTSTNGLFVNGAPQALGRGTAAALADGDRLELGDYLIEVRIAEHGGAGQTMDDPFGIAQIDPPHPSAGSGGVGDMHPAPRRPPMGGTPLSIDLDRDDPFHDPLADPWRPDAPPANSPLSGPPIPRSPLPGVPPPSAPTSGSPLGGPQFGAPGAAPFIPDDDDFLGPMEPAPWQGATQSDHLPAFSQSFQPPPAVSVIPDDWESESAAPPEPIPTVPPLAPEAPVQYEPQYRPDPEPVEETRTPFSIPPGAAPFDTGSAVPPSLAPASSGPAQSAPASPAPALSAPIVSPALAPAPSAPAPSRPGGAARPAVSASSMPGAAAASGLAAFLEGAGLADFDAGNADSDAMLHDLGAVFRDLAEGLREILAARAMVKNEFRVERTMIGAVDNNPLKFSAGGEEMLRLLLRPTAGYMPAPRAVRDGVDDMKAHQMASMAGMQAAVDYLLGQFDPEILKGRLEGRSLAGRVLPAARKARYWDLYETLYKDILKEVRDSFLGLFGREFARAYEEQSRKL